jgi:lipopolysaccharide/colanic/teichoic acid biosynthesis glycosyltransferase
VSSLLLGEVVSTHVALLVGYPFIRSLHQVDSSSAERHNTNSTVPPGSSWVNSRARRVLDFTIAALALLLLTPLMAVCWLLVRFSSPGPVFFRQLRAGRNGREFALYKFRSMRTHNISTRSGPTVFGNGHITFAGSFLRRYKMDELPQFWNVLRGDMGLVGPRPKLAHHEALRMPYRPGLTGKATLAFRNEERMLLEVPQDQIDQFYESVVKPIKASLDVHYMENATLSSDFGLLWRTFTRCIHCSDDARQELDALIDLYAPEYAGLIPQESRAHVSSPQQPMPSFQPELTDDLVGDLDDAA